jgi:glycosyltransferase involved in cell wall biosynthesis
MHLTIATIVRNEASRFLPSALEAWRTFADRIVVLDDGSDDGTAQLCEDAGCEVYERPALMFGNEWRARRELWRTAVGPRLFAEGDASRPVNITDWVLHLDADQVPSCDPRPFLKAPVSYFRVYDLWSEDTYREDAWWTGHQRCWWPAVHVPSLPADFVDQWPERGWHSGHVPMNIPREGHPVDGCAILHYAYVTAELRLNQAAKYEALGEAGHLTAQERFHAKTILTPNPHTKLLPFEVKWPLTFPASQKP